MLTGHDAIIVCVGLRILCGGMREMKVKVTFEYELEDKQREQFEDVRAEEGEEAAFYFIEDLVRKEIEVAEAVEAEYKEDEGIN